MLSWICLPDGSAAKEVRIVPRRGANNAPEYRNIDDETKGHKRFSSGDYMQRSAALRRQSKPKINDSRAQTPVEAAESLIPELRRQSKSRNH